MGRVKLKFKKIIAIRGCVLLLFVYLSALNNLYAVTPNYFINEANSFLSKYIKYGAVNYSIIKSRENEIKRLYTIIGKVNLGDDNNEAKAFYINAYNLIVIKGVIDNYPYMKPIDKKGFFSSDRHLVAGDSITLDYLEHEILIGKFKDCRIHFVLACAAKSCPKLPSRAVLPEDLDYQLNMRTKIALNDPNFIKIDMENKHIKLSKIFDWYADDFPVNREHILEYINSYRLNKIPENYKLSYYEFNWELNEVKN